ncbi:MAG: DedA family protein [Gammaproteobacteria bacterium]|nr:DedA family protein [Gammaproteobacteria bacterium]NNC96527.1 DedA family protein [Gammaproteobacteria bacterium]NNM13031.1 DedA family protein [Gammaproteobacteria bacterium]
MRIFTGLYERVLQWSRHRHAPAYLSGLSFAESSFFPIPPDVMLAPMALSQPHKAWYFAFLTTVFSVLGGIAGYAIGMFAFGSLEPWLLEHGYAERLTKAQNWFDAYGLWVVLAAGFSPIPYKIFTITAGALALFFPSFVIASVIGRGARFYLVAGLIKAGGVRMEEKIRKHVEIIGWIVVVLLALLIWLISRH